MWSTIIGTLAISLIINLLFFWIEIVPNISRYLAAIGKRLNFNDNFSPLDVAIVKKASMKMLVSNKANMTYNQHSDFMSEILKRTKSNRNAIILNNYPKAFLLYGYYRLAKSDTKTIETICNKFIDLDGKSILMYDKVDQAVFGMTYLSLYQDTQKIRYLTASKEIYNFIKAKIDIKHDIILYRENKNVQLIDTLGLVCPFLFMYSKLIGDNDAERIAHNLIYHYINNGLESCSQLPFHGYNLDSRLKIGPINWGRGIGWYSLALSFGFAYSKNEKLKEDYQSRLKKIKEIFNQNKNKAKKWTQFIGQNKNAICDSSTTTMYILSMQLAGIENYSFEEIQLLLSDIITKKGYIENCSGDTFAINHYSYLFSQSELSQGFLCAILSLCNKANN